MAKRISLIALILATMVGVNTYAQSNGQIRTVNLGNVPTEFVFVQGGQFLMGDGRTQGYDRTARPTHTVTVDSYCMASTEVTQRLWKEFMGSNPSTKKDDNMPVNNVSWDDCQEFLGRLNRITGGNFRLPTEAEWEFAARGGTLGQGTTYSGGDVIEDVAWYDDNSRRKPHAVATRRPNELGLYDLSGNVAEWCADIYAKNYYEESPSYNPQGAGRGTYRVFRGGSYDTDAERAMVWTRMNAPQTTEMHDVGLRLVTDAESLGRVASRQPQQTGADRQRPQQTQRQQPSVSQPVADDASQRIYQGANDLERGVLNSPDIKALTEYLTRSIGDGKLRQIVTTDDFGSAPTNAYIVVFDRQYRIMALLRPAVNGMREDAATGSNVYMDQFKGFNGFWFR